MDLWCSSIVEILTCKFGDFDPFGQKRELACQLAVSMNPSFNKLYFSAEFSTKELEREESSGN